MENCWKNVKGSIEPVLREANHCVIGAKWFTDNAVTTMWPQGWWYRWWWWWWWPQYDHRDDDIDGWDSGTSQPSWSGFGPQRPFWENGPSHKLLKFWSEKTVDKIDKRPKWGWMDGIKAGSSVQSLFSFYVSQSFQTTLVPRVAWVTNISSAPLCQK